MKQHFMGWLVMLSLQSEFSVSRRWLSFDLVHHGDKSVRQKSKSPNQKSQAHIYSCQAGVLDALMTTAPCSCSF